MVSAVLGPGLRGKSGYLIFGNFRYADLRHFIGRISESEQNRADGCTDQILALVSLSACPLAMERIFHRAFP